MAPQFGFLIGAAGDDDQDARDFLAHAIDQLADNYGKIVAVRLAVFAEMVQAQPWNPATLKKVGGTEGVGVAFLEETLGPRTRYPILHRHAEAARSILKALVMLLSSQPPIVGALGNTQVSKHPTPGGR